ncbi:MAG: hypothetical protein WC807_11620 [Hyphomicrobium sp.]|jgi:general secretion pathway protein K
MTNRLAIESARKRNRGDTGAALVIVLWVVLVLSLEVGAITLQMVDGLNLVENATAAMRGQALMHAAVDLAAMRLAARDSKDRWVAAGQTHVVTIAGVDVRLSISDENSRININAAEPELLNGLIFELTGSRAEAERMTDQIVDWRDADHERRHLGAEDGDYARSGQGRGAADQPFLDPADLTRVIDMREELAASLWPNVTVYSADGHVNPASASPTVLRALPGASRQSIDHREAAQDGGRSSQAGDLADAQKYLSQAQGPSYRICVTTSANQRSAAASGMAIVTLGLDAAVPYRTIAWRFRPGLATDCNL